MTVILIRTLFLNILLLRIFFKSTQCQNIWLKLSINKNDVNLILIKVEFCIKNVSKFFLEFCVRTKILRNQIIKNVWEKVKFTKYSCKKISSSCSISSRILNSKFENLKLFKYKNKSQNPMT
jgi:hypothetical protein